MACQLQGDHIVGEYGDVFALCHFLEDIDGHVDVCAKVRGECVARCLAEIV